jgi:hypothetical protein
MAAKSTLTTPYDFDRVITDVLGLPAPRRPIFEAPTVVLQPPPLSEATVGLLVTSGAYFPDQQRLGETEDLSFRLLSRDRGLEGVLFAHMTPIRAFALADPNVAYPLDRMLELESAGVIGKLADYAISMVGSVANYEGLALETAGNVVAECESMGVDLLLVLPFCPQCHMSAGVQHHHVAQDHARREAAAAVLSGLSVGLHGRTTVQSAGAASDPDGCTDECDQHARLAVGDQPSPVQLG